MTEEMSLEDFQLTDAEPEGVNEGFVITTESQAAWAMRKLAVAQRRIDQVSRHAAEEVDRIERWKAYATKTDQATVDRFTALLSSYIIRLRDEGRKSLALPDGNVKSREVPEKIKVDDLETFLKWAEMSGHGYAWTRVKKEIDLAKVKKDVFYSGELVVDAETGETVEGLSHVEASVSVTVEVSE